MPPPRVSTSETNSPNNGSLGFSYCYAGTNRLWYYLTVDLTTRRPRSIFTYGFGRW